MVRSVLPHSALASTDFSFLDEREKPKRSLKQSQDAAHGKNIYSRPQHAYFCLSTQVSNHAEVGKAKEMKAKANLGGLTVMMD